MWPREFSENSVSGPIGSAGDRQCSCACILIGMKHSACCTSLVSVWSWHYGMCSMKPRRKPDVMGFRSVLPSSIRNLERRYIFQDVSIIHFLFHFWHTDVHFFRNCLPRIILFIYKFIKLTGAAPQNHSLINWSVASFVHSMFTLRVIWAARFSVLYRLANLPLMYRQQSEPHEPVAHEACAACIGAR